MENLNVLDDHVLVEILPDDDWVTEGGIILPERATAPNKKLQRGQVVSVGEGRLVQDPDNGDFKRVPHPIKAGMHIVFPKHIGFPVTLGDRTAGVFIKIGDVMATINQE